MAYQVLKEDLFQYLADCKIFPGYNEGPSDCYASIVKDTIFDYIGVSESEAADNVVEEVDKQSKNFAIHAYQHWKKNK